MAARSVRDAEVAGSNPAVPTLTKDRARCPVLRASLAAELYLYDSDPEGRRVAVSNAVHAGIAASDAICCAVLGEHAVGDDHQTAANLLASVGRQTTQSAKALGAHALVELLRDGERLTGRLR